MCGVLCDRWLVEVGSRRGKAKGAFGGDFYYVTAGFKVSEAFEIRMSWQTQMHMDKVQVTDRCNMHIVKCTKCTKMAV